MQRAGPPAVVALKVVMVKPVNYDPNSAAESSPGWAVSTLKTA